MKRFIAKVSKSFKGGEKGFTLIELLIVIVILGVLAAAIIPNLSKFLGSGQVGAANAELASVRTGIAAYQADHDGKLPVSGDGDLPVVVFAAGTADTVVSDAVKVYIIGSSGIKATYTVGDDGTITDGDPTTTVDSALVSPDDAWGATVVAWGADKWEKP